MNNYLKEISVKLNNKITNSPLYVIISKFVISVIDLYISLVMIISTKCISVQNYIYSERYLLTMDDPKLKYILTMNVALSNP